MELELEAARAAKGNNDESKGGDGAGDPDNDA